MRKRVISGLTGALLVILILFFNQTHPAVLNIAAAIISVLAIHEVFCVVGNPAQWLITIPTTIFVACVPLFSCSLSWNAIWYIYSIWMFSLMLIKPDIKFISIAKIYTMAILIAASFGYMISLRDLGESNGSFFVLLGLCIAWMSDTGAYFCGKIFGKNKLYPEISPKKMMADMKETKMGRKWFSRGLDIIDKVPTNMRFNWCKHNIRFSVYPPIVLVSYIFLKETEILNLINIIEGVKYKLDPDEIKKMLIV